MDQVATQMNEIIQLTAKCPDCGSGMYYRHDKTAKRYLKRLLDPGEYGCEYDHYYCKSCDKTVEMNEVTKCTNG